MEPPIKDSQSKGHNRNNLSIKGTLQGPKCSFPIFLIHSEPLKSGQPLYKGQHGWPERVLCLEVAHILDIITSLQYTPCQTNTCTYTYTYNDVVLFGTDIFLLTTAGIAIILDTLPLRCLSASANKKNVAAILP